MVGLPSAENRDMILKTLLSKEKVDEGLDFKELATMTDGYSGSDLENLCTTAAYRPMRELIRQETLKDMVKYFFCPETLKDMEIKPRIQEGQISEGTSLPQQKNVEKTITIRSLNMADFREAKNQVAASYAAEGSAMSELKQGNNVKMQE